MSKVATILPAEFTRFSSDNVRESAEKGMSQARDAYEKFSASAREATGSFDASAVIVARGVSEFNAKAFAAFQANTSAAFDFLASLAAVKSPTEIVALQSEFAGKQLKALGEQSKELSALTQKIAKDCVEPIKDHLEKAFKSIA